MEAPEAIRTRRSIREYSKKIIPKEKIEKILVAEARWAPSGIDNQPWCFVIVTDKKTKDLLAKQTHYEDTIKSAPMAICVFYDAGSGYDRTKDVLSIGACIQNMLLAAHSQGLGACWLGEILKNKETVAALFKAPAGYELMAVITLGEPAENPKETNRKE